MRPALLACAFLLAVAAATAARPPAPVLNVAHRGASGWAPEHTFAAYDLALASGADYIEQDLQVTSDGVLVVLHDATLDRTARGAPEHCTGLVATKTLAQIKTCDAGRWFNEARPDLARPEYVGLRIPTLDEVFRRYGRRVNYYIETKSPAPEDRMEERLLALLAEHRLLKRAARHWTVLIQSFSAASLEKIHAMEPALPLVQLGLAFGTGAALEQSLDRVTGYAVAVGPNAGLLGPDLVPAAHGRCLGVHPWTVNQASDMARLLALGVDAMFTDVPDELDRVLGTAALRRKQAARRAARRYRACARGIRPGAPRRLSP